VSATSSLVQQEVRDTAILRYYRWHAPIYDLTRWTFLFGRGALLRRLAPGPAPSHIIEIGCGTGRNLAVLARRFPTARLTGIDLSQDMLTRAKLKLSRFGSRVSWRQQRFDARSDIGPAGDLLLFSYSLSMMNPGWEEALPRAALELKPGGRIAVVDFAGTPWSGFRRWMACNHVRTEDHLLPALKALFRPLLVQERRAYAGLWRYFLFVGTAP
jgi:S-adenosylmethionine-diacylgycerolhomoserine-N-methlytransferase